MYEKTDGKETCLNIIVTCKICREDIKLTKAIKHECFNNALISSLFGIIKNQVSDEPQILSEQSVMTFSIAEENII